MMEEEAPKSVLGKDKEFNWLKNEAGKEDGGTKRILVFDCQKQVVFKMVSVLNYAHIHISLLSSHLFTI